MIKNAIAALIILSALGAQPARATTACDYSFILRQPTFALVAPEASTSSASLATPLGLATDAADFKGIRSVQLVPDVGQALLLTPKLKSVPMEHSTRAGLSGNPVHSVATMPIPQLRPSTTYDVILTVRTIAAPPHCPSTLTERIARFTTESATSLDAIALAHASSAPASGGHLSGPEIFENALHELSTLDYPPVVSFLVTVRSTVEGKLFFESFRSSLRSGDNIVTTHSIPLATTNQPENPWGFNIKIPLLGSLFSNQRKGNHSEPFGVPEMSPAYTFGLLPPKPVQFPGRQRFQYDPDVKSLGRVLTIARNYDATLLGVEQYRSRFVYHLKLTPIDNPETFRLRELWVDTQAFVIWKLRTAGIFPEGPATTIPWEVNYTVVDGHWFIAQESTTSSVRTGGFLANTPEVRYDGITYTFSDFTYPVDSDFDFFSEVKTQAIQY